MNRALVLVASSAAMAALSGCWSFGTSEYPQTEITPMPGGEADTNAVSVAVTGFSATRVDYAPVYGLETVYVPDVWVCRRGSRRAYLDAPVIAPGRYETYSTVAYVPQTRLTDTYLRRAKDALERAGISVAAPTPDWTLDVAFSGPATTDADSLRQIGWNLCTLFFCDYAAASWTAQLRVRDNRTGRLVFHNDYVQRYETKVFGLIPLLSISSADETSFSHIQGWCLAALTDRIVADATAFFASRAAP